MIRFLISLAKDRKVGQNIGYGYKAQLLQSYVYVKHSLKLIFNFFILLKIRFIFVI